jgi:hypothetical protein
LGDVGEITFPYILLIDVIVDIHGLLGLVAAEPLDILARHAGSEQVGSVPMPATVRTEALFHLLGVRVGESHTHCGFHDHQPYTASIQADPTFPDEKGRVLGDQFGPGFQPSLKGLSGFLIEKDYSIGALGRRLEGDTQSIEGYI